MQYQENLLEKAKLGDIRAFHKLYAEFQAKLKSYLYRLLANRNNMEDMAHDVFIIVFENIKSFKGKSSLKTLLQNGWKAQQAREILPNSLKTEIVMKALQSSAGLF